MRMGPSDSGEETQHHTRLLTVELQASARGAGLDWDRVGQQTLMTRRGFTDSSDGGPVNRLSVRSSSRKISNQFIAIALGHRAETWRDQRNVRKRCGQQRCRKLSERITSTCNSHRQRLLPGEDQLTPQIGFAVGGTHVRHKGSKLTTVMG